MASDPIDSQVKMETGETEMSYADVVKARLQEVFQKMTNKVT